MEECSRLNVSSVAIPSLGAGNLFYPHSIVAKCLLEETFDYLMEHDGITSLKTVHFVLLDAHMYTTFLRQLLVMLTDSIEDAPQSHVLKIREGAGRGHDTLCIFGRSDVIDEAEHILRLIVDAWEVMQLVRDAKRRLVSLFVKTIEAFKEKGILLVELQSFIASRFLELADDVQSCESMQAVMGVIQRCTSVVNQVYLRYVADHFKLHEITSSLNEYSVSLQYLCNEVPLERFDGIEFMAMFSGVLVTGLENFRYRKLAFDQSWMQKNLKDVDEIRVKIASNASSFVILDSIEVEQKLIIVQFLVFSSLIDFRI